jgi:hypothetical protein
MLPTNFAVMLLNNKASNGLPGSRRCNSLNFCGHRIPAGLKSSCPEDASNRASCDASLAASSGFYSAERIPYLVSL